MRHTTSVRFPVLAAVAAIVFVAGPAANAAVTLLNVNIDNSLRTSLVGPAGGAGETWNQRLGNPAAFSGANLLDSGGIQTTVGFTLGGDWRGPDTWGPELDMLKGGAWAYGWATPTLVIDGLTAGNKYDLYIASAYVNEGGYKHITSFSTANSTITSSPQTAENSGNDGSTWVQGQNYVLFQEVLPDGSHKITFSLSGVDGKYQVVNGFQILGEFAALAPPTWKGSSTSNKWAVDGNWINLGGGTFPDSAGAEAIFGDVGQLQPTVDLESAGRTIGKAFFRSTNDTTIETTGTGSLIFQQTTGDASIVAAGADHRITAPVVLKNNINIETTDASDKLTISGGISEDPATSGRTLTKSGDGTLVLGGDNSYTGATRINRGTLQAAATLVTSTSRVIITPSGTLALRGDASATFSPAVELSDNGATISVDQASTAAEGTTFSLNGIRMVNATLQLNATGANGVSLDLGDATGQSDHHPIFNNTIASPGKLLINNILHNPNYNRPLGQVSFDGTGSTIVNGVIETIRLNKWGSGTTTLKGASAYTGATTITGGTLSIASIADGGLTPTLTTTAGSEIVIASDTAGLVVGQVVVSANIPAGRTIASIVDATQFTLNDGTSVTDGTDVASTIGTANSLGIATNAAGNLVFNGGGLQYTGPAGATDRLFTLNAGGGTIDASGTGAIVWSNAGSLSGTGALTLTGANAGANTLSASITSASSLTKAGAGTWVLSGANTYTGTTTVSAGVLNLGVAENVGTSGPLGQSGSIVLTGGTLQYSGVNQTDYSDRFSTADNQCYNVDTNDQPVTWATALTSSGGTLTKSGAGTLTLSGANTYTGLTTVKAGTLQLAASAQTVVLSGTGADIQGGKMLLDGAPDVRTPLAYSYHAGAWDRGQFKSTTADASHGLGWENTGSQMKVAYTFYGDATLDGSVDATDLAKVLANYNQLSGMVWGQGDFDYNAAVDATDLAKVLANYNQGPIVPGITAVGTAAGFTVVPEPSTLALIAAGVIGLLGFAWRR